MKKFAHTLAEALIAIAIIGIIAGVTAPLVSKFKPDTNKVLFLKAYDSIVDATNSIASNNRFYPVINEGDNINYNEHPLFNINHSVNVNGGAQSGSTKYCELLADALSAESINCSNANLNAPSIVTQNGMQFWVNTIRTISGNTGTYRSSITFDINGTEGENCQLDVCTNPDRFLLNVRVDGEVVAGDQQALQYIQTRQNYRLNRDAELPPLGNENFTFAIIFLAD